MTQVLETMIGKEGTKGTEIDLEALEAVRWSHFKIRGAYNFKDLMESNYVSGEGNFAEVMLIGEAPGAQEDIAKRPFVGQAGQVLRELMLIPKLYTGQTPHFGTPNCWLTNVLKFRPPRNRNPSPKEIKVFRHLLRTEWQAVGCPRVIVPIGGVALTAIVGKPIGILAHSGWLHKCRSREGQRLALWPMIHPSYGLRNKGVQPLIEKDWEKFGEWLNEYRN